MNTGATAHAAAETQPAQLGLEGLAPPPAMPLLKLSLVGHLQRMAEIRTHTDGSAHVVVQVLQPRDGLPFVAVHRVPADAVAAMEQMALRMTPGTAVLLVGRGIELSDHRGHPVLRLTHCDQLLAVNAADYLTDLQLEPHGSNA